MDIRSLVQAWQRQHHPFHKELILDHALMLCEEGLELLRIQDFFKAAQDFAEAISMYLVLERDGYLNDRHEQSRKDTAYFYHAQACIRIADHFEGDGSAFLEHALRSVKNLSVDYENKVSMRLVVNIKLAMWQCEQSKGTALIGRLRRHRDELQRMDGAKLDIVMAFFSSSVDYLLTAMADMIGPVLADDSEDPKKVDQSWIPKQHLPQKKKQVPTKKKKKKAKTPYFSDYDTFEETSVGVDEDLQEEQEEEGQAKSQGASAGACSFTKPSSGSKPRKMSGLPDQTKQWMKNYQFRLACNTCFWQVPRKYGYNSYRLNKDFSHTSKCKKKLLICELSSVAPSNGYNVVYGLIRYLPSNARFSLCQDFVSKYACKERNCSSCHSREEREIWKAEKEGRFDREEIMKYLRSSQSSGGDSASMSSIDTGKEDETHMARSSGLRGIRSRQESISSQGKSSSKSSTAGLDSFNEGPQIPRLGGKKKSQAASVSHQAAGERTSSRKVPEQTPRMKATAASSCQMSSKQLPPHIQGKMGLVQQMMSSLRGKLLVMCRSCFNDTPQKISSPRSSNPTICTNYRPHQMGSSNRCLVYKSMGEYMKVRERPFKKLFKPMKICCYLNAPYGCLRRESCNFAHNQAESTVWWIEALHRLKREEFMDICTEIIQPSKAHPGPSAKYPETAKQTSSTQQTFSTQQTSSTQQYFSTQQTSSTQQTYTNQQTTRQVETGAREEPTRLLPNQSQSRNVNVSMTSGPSRPSGDSPEIPPFQHKIKVVCERCFSDDPTKIEEQNPQRPSYCTGKKRHTWILGAHTIYVVFSTSLNRWIRMNSRHPRLRPNIQLFLCRKGTRCKQELVYRTQCMFPHFQEELDLWKYQNQHNLKTIDQVIKLQNQCRDDERLANEPDAVEMSRFNCSYCKSTFRTETSFEAHILSDVHKARILSDSEFNWKYRSPPQHIIDGSYHLCKNNIKDQCEFSGSSQEENDCISAHSVDELDEWKERHEFRLMKLNKARNEKLFSWLNELENKRAASIEQDAIDVMTEEIYGIETECNEDLDVIYETPTEEDEEVSWEFIVHANSEKPLKRVGLLYDRNRPQFYLSQPEREHCPQTCPGSDMRKQFSDDYQITVNFNSSRYGYFEQWVVFDFGDFPVLLRKLTVHIGSDVELEQYKSKQEAEKLSAELWTETNSKIINYSVSDRWLQNLMNCFPERDSHKEYSNGEKNVLNMEKTNYHDFMHHMLLEEELECRERVSRYSTVTEMEILTQIQLDSLLFPQPGQLFAKIHLDRPLHDDSESSQIVQKFVQTVFIKFDMQSNIVYEAEIIYTRKDMSSSQKWVPVCLSPHCVKDWGLLKQVKKGSGQVPKMTVSVQFHVNRLQFLFMHHAVDRLSCMDTVMPTPHQENRFPDVDKSDCPAELNTRQFQAVLSISAGTRQTTNQTSGAATLSETETSCRSGPTLILGPFGTGKTHTLAMAVQETLLQSKDARILICTHSNSAADLYITNYLKKFSDQENKREKGAVRMTRIASRFANMKAMPQDVREFVSLNAEGLIQPGDDKCQEWVSDVKQGKPGTKAPNLVLITLGAAVHLTKTLTLRGYFTHIVIDEAGQALETEAIIPLALATKDTYVVLAGDPKQMSPKVYSPHALKAQFDMSLLRRLYMYVKRNSCNSSLLLDKNYRSCQPILDLVGVFYGCRLKSRFEEMEHPNLYPINFVSVKGTDEMFGRSYINKEEAVEIVEKVGSLLENWPKDRWGPVRQDDIVVLSPYQMQIELIRSGMRKKRLHGVTVERVQNVQGKEYRAVFLSTVRTRLTLNQMDITAIPQAGKRTGESKYWYGFLSDQELLNTALTRAQSLIVAVGDPVALCSAGDCQRTWQRFIRICESNSGIYPESLTMGQIANEITAAKRVICPQAKAFVPISTPKKSVQHSDPQRTARATAYEIDSDDEEDIIPKEEWLQDLKDQMIADMTEEYQRTHPEEEQDGAVPKSRTEARDVVQIAHEEGSDLPSFGRPAFVPQISLQNDDRILEDMRMVERGGRVAIFQRSQSRPVYAQDHDETYDSDEEDIPNIDQRQSYGHSEEELLRMTFRDPDKFKLCIFHQDITGRMKAIPEDRESGEEITITSTKRRGQALDSDKVVVQIIEDNEEREDDEDSLEITYGIVIGVVERNSDLQLKKFVCCLDPHSDNVMVPLDRTCPKMFILAQKKAEKKHTNVATVRIYDILKRNVHSGKACTRKREVQVTYAERSHKLFIVRYLEWPKNNPYPLGAVTEVLEPGDDLPKGMKILKLIHGVKGSCKKSTTRQLKQDYPDNWSVPAEDIICRTDLRRKKIFTIDPPDSKDLDDAISVDRLSGHRYEVGVHIADVSYFVKKDSPLDKEAFMRGTSFYHPFPGNAFHMLPEELSTRLCSLLPGQDRLAVSVHFTLDENGQMVSEPRIDRTVIRSIQRLTYKQAEQIIDGDAQSFPELFEPIKDLHGLALHRRVERLGDGWMVFNADDDDGGTVCHPFAHSLIEEFMIMANRLVANRLLTTFPACAPLRRQLGPSPEQVEEWHEHNYKTALNSVYLPVLTKLNQDDDDDFDDLEENEVQVTAEVWKRTLELIDPENPTRDMEEAVNIILQDGNHPKQAVALKAYHRIMEPAEYIDATSQQDPDRRSHYSLNVPAYVHFTSPIRRYIDLIVHRMLVADLERSQSPYTAGEMAEITHHCNNQNARSKRFSKEASTLKLALALKEAPLQLTTFIEGITDKSMKMQIPYRSYIPSNERSLQFTVLKPSGKPEEEDGRVTMIWKNRVYDSNTKARAKSPSTLRFPQQSFNIPEDKWREILDAVRERDGSEIFRAILSAALHGKYNGNPFPKISEDKEEKGKGILCYQRDYHVGDTCKIQMHSLLVRGLLTPKIQLFDVTPNLQICAEHRIKPIECFSRIATSIPGRERGIEKYQEKWLQIINMMAAHSAVNNDDTVILENVTIHWQRQGGRVSGYFELCSKFLQKHHISIYVAKDGTLRNSYDYLCIHIKDLAVDSKPRLNIRRYDKHPNAVGPYNADDWKKQVFVLHCLVMKAGRSLAISDDGTTTIFEEKKYPKRVRKDDSYRQVEEEPVMLRVNFVVHQTSLPFPDVIPMKGKYVASTVELIQMPEPNRREEEALLKIDKSPNLMRDIALQRPNKPDTFTDTTLRTLLAEGKKFENKRLSVSCTTLNPLNEPQSQAIKSALTNTFTLIQGPPGTGKTMTGAYLAYFFSRLNEQVRTGKGRPHVLYCGPSNKSVDVVANYLKTFKDISVVRIYGVEIERKEFPIPGVPGLISKWSRKEVTMPPELRSISMHHLIREPDKKYAEELSGMERRFRRHPQSVTQYDIEDYKSLITTAMNEELKNHHVVLATCHAAGAFRTRRSLNVMQVIVDEAGMCSEPNTLIPLVLNEPKQVVLIGDHKQLRSIITEPNAKQLDMDISLLEKYQKKARMLTIQYRMHEEICRFPSDAFYDGRLKTDQSVKRRPRDPLHRIWPNGGTTPRMFCHVSGKEDTLSVRSAEGNQMSKSNKAEIRHVMRIVDVMLGHGVRPESIVILSQYQLQISQITQELKEKGKLNGIYNRIHVSTVIKSQGSEWEYVIFSTVRSKPRIEIEPKPSKSWQRKHLGFINDENQMNVALTRAKQGLIIIGNQYLLSTHEQWRNLIAFYRTTGCLKEAREFLQTQ